MDKKTRAEVEAAAFRRLVHHFRERSDVQNIDLMTLAGFCRNCLAKWYDAAREIVYGMLSLLFIASALPTTARFSGTDTKLI